MLRSVAAAGFKVNNDVQIDHENVAKNPIERGRGRSLRNLLRVIDMETQKKEVHEICL